VSVPMTLSETPNSGFKVTVHLQVEYLKNCTSVQRIRGFGDNALYKSTFYLLTYLLRDKVTVEH